MDANKSQFVRIVTHELRSPTRVIASLLNVLGKDYVGDLNEQQADLVERYGGNIQVESIERQGTTVTLTFPLIQKK